MMNSLFSRRGRLSFYFIVLLAISSCKKDGSVDEQNEILQTVNFKVSGFSNVIAPLKAAVVKTRAQASTQSSNNQNYIEGYLYFWSFNSESLEPDIAFQKNIAPVISYTKGGLMDQVPHEFPASAYAYDGRVGGNAVSIVGASEIFMKLPIVGVEQITEFGFDTGSSGTGPKDFELYYSVDEGNSYQPLALLNQFANNGVTNTPKNSYVYSLSDKNINSNSLWFKFIPKAGTRVEGSTFNASSGAWRFDNIRLVGMAPSSQTSSSINKLHYFLFHKDKPGTVIHGSTPYEEASNLTLDLPVGKYAICFVANTSAKDLLLPETLIPSDFYIGNQFSNAAAEIFGYAGELEVTGDMESQIRLQRLFSQIKLEFTDVADLSLIQKIGISQEHDPFFYAPFNTTLTNPVLDQSDIEITADFNVNKQLVFNQFMGVSSSAVPLKYNVVLYGSQGVLRTFQLQSTLMHNMQLVFRGNLLETIQADGKFQIYKQTDWDGQKESVF